MWSAFKYICEQIGGHFVDDVFKYISQKKVLSFDFIFTEVCSHISNCHKVSIGSGIDLVTNNKPLPEPLLVQTSLMTCQTKLTYLLVDKIVIISQTFSLHFLWMKIFVFFIWFLLKFVPLGPIDNKSALIQVMVWCWTDDKPLPEPVLTQSSDSYMQHFKLAGDELTM